MPVAAAAGSGKVPVKPRGGQAPLRAGSKVIFRMLGKIGAGGGEFLATLCKTGAGGGEIVTALRKIGAGGGAKLEMPGNGHMGWGNICNAWQNRHGGRGSIRNTRQNGRMGRGSTCRDLYFRTSTGRGRRPRVARRRSIAAIVSSIMVLIRKPIGGGGVSWGARAQGVGVRGVGVRRRAM